MTRTWGPGASRPRVHGHSTNSRRYLHSAPIESGNLSQRCLTSFDGLFYLFKRGNGPANVPAVGPRGPASGDRPRGPAAGARRPESGRHWPSGPRGTAGSGRPVRGSTRRHAEGEQPEGARPRRAVLSRWTPRPRCRPSRGTLACAPPPRPCWLMSSLEVSDDRVTRQPCHPFQQLFEHARNGTRDSSRLSVGSDLSWG